MLNYSLEKPSFDQNYHSGDIGFTYKIDSPIAMGIAHFTRHDRKSEINVAHVFLVEDEHHVLEAHLNTGVARNPIAPYFEDANRVTFFRRLKHRSPQIIEAILTKARDTVGSPYDVGLILGYALTGGGLRNEYLPDWYVKAKERIHLALDDPDAFICSEFICACLKPLVQYREMAILQQPIAAITPQELFEADELYEQDIFT